MHCVPLVACVCHARRAGRCLGRTEMSLGLCEVPLAVHSSVSHPRCAERRFRVGIARVGITQGVQGVRPGRAVQSMCAHPDPLRHALALLRFQENSRKWSEAGAVPGCTRTPASATLLRPVPFLQAARHSPRRPRAEMGGGRRKKVRRKTKETQSACGTHTFLCRAVFFFALPRSPHIHPHALSPPPPVTSQRRRPDRHHACVGATGHHRTRLLQRRSPPLPPPPPPLQQGPPPQSEKTPGPGEVSSD